MPLTRKVVEWAYRVGSPYVEVLWADDEPEFHGEFFDFEPVWSYPKPHRTPHPPLLASAIGPHGVRASLPWADGWIPGDTSVPDIAVALIEFRRAAEDAGRDPATLDLTVLAWGDPTVATLERYRELGFGRAVVGAGRQSAADIDSTWAFLDTYAPLLDA